MEEYEQEGSQHKDVGQTVPGQELARPVGYEVDLECVPES